MNVFIPPELNDIEADLHRFFDAMVFKLRKNSHKGRWEDLNLEQSFVRMREEVEELRKALAEGNQIEMILEAADVANFAMILAAIAIRDKR